MHIAELPHGYAEMRSDGTWILHPFKFHHVGDDIIRIDFDSSGNVVKKSFHEPNALITVDEVTGVIEQIQQGFVLDHEVLGPPPAPPGKLLVQVRSSEVDGLRSSDDSRVMAKRYDAQTGAFVDRPLADIAEDVARLNSSSRGRADSEKL